MSHSLVSRDFATLSNCVFEFEEILCSIIVTFVTIDRTSLPQHRIQRHVGILDFEHLRKDTSMNLSNNLLAIFALAISSSCVLAQSSFSVTQPQAGFSTVINLPENPDSPNPVDFFDSIGSDTQLNLSDGGSIGGDSPVFFAGLFDFDVPSTNIEINIAGGTVDGLFLASDSTVNISGGAINTDVFVVQDGELNVSAGNANSIDANNSAVDISGGTIRVFNSGGSTTNITGGTISDFLNAVADSTVNISGGTISGLSAQDTSTVNILGTEFFLNGTPIDSLLVGQTLIIDERGDDSTLSGSLVDGSQFEFDLNPTFGEVDDSFSLDSNLTITLVAAVPEPSCGLALTCLLYTSPSPRD